MNYPDPIQLSLNPGLRMETALVALIDDLWWHQDGGGISILLLHSGL